MTTKPTKLEAKEDATLIVQATFKDEDDVVVPPDDLNSVKFWLHDQNEVVINSRSDVDILNAGPGVVDANGVLTLTLAPADQPIISDSNLTEIHILTIEWTWNGGAAKSHEEIHLVVRNSTHVPTS